MHTFWVGRVDALHMRCVICVLDRRDGRLAATEAAGGIHAVLDIQVVAGGRRIREGAEDTVEYDSGEGCHICSHVGGD